MNASEQKELFNLIHEQPLFNKVSNDEFQVLMKQCKLKKYSKYKKLDYFRAPEEGLLLVIKGAVEVFIESDDGMSIVLEVLQEGEVIGFSNIAHYLGEINRPLDRHRIEMEMLEEATLLQIPIKVVQEVLKDNSVRDFVLKKMSTRLANVYASLGEQVKLSDEWGESEPYVRRVQDFMNAPVVTVDNQAIVQDIANIMVDKSVSSVMVVDHNERLLGIVTEKDLVQRVVAHGLIGPLKAEDIMTRKVHTLSPDDFYYEALSTFYKHGVKHLPVIEDKRVTGIVTLSNLMSKRDRGSMAILKTIEESTYENLPVVKNTIYNVLSNLINDDISTIHTLEIITKLYDRLARHCVKLAISSLETQGKGTPPVPFAWYQMGSGARGEQFMLTDQDHFLVYDNPVNVNKQLVDEYFSLLGDEIVAHLEQAGYTRCKGLMMSSEEIWRGSVNEWQQRLRTWAIKSTDEHILLGYNFMSFRYLYGDPSLNDRFVNMVNRQLRSSQTFLYYMAQQELNNPIPLFSNKNLITLFRGKGKRETIDIKLNALFPLHHCLQILGVHKNIINMTPLQLLDGLVEKGEFTPEFAEDIRHAYEVALKTRIKLSWKKHLRNEKITTEIKFSTIRRWERDELITMLTAVHALQSHLIAKL